MQKAIIISLGVLIGIAGIPTITMRMRGGSCLSANKASLQKHFMFQSQSFIGTGPIMTRTRIRTFT